MIVTDVGNDAHQRTDDVGRIETAAHSDFDHRYIDLVPRKTIECNGRSDLEKRRLHPVDRPAIPFDETDHFLLGNHSSVDPDAFPEILQVRRSEKPRPISGRRQRRSDHMRHGAFTVRPGYVNAADFAVRIPQSLLQRHDIIESGLVSATADVLKHRQRIIQKIERLLISHSNTIWTNKTFRAKTGRYTFNRRYGSSAGNGRP